MSSHPYGTQRISEPFDDDGYPIVKEEIPGSSFDSHAMPPPSVRAPNAARRAFTAGQSSSISPYQMSTQPSSSFDGLPSSHNPYGGPAQPSHAHSSPMSHQASRFGQSSSDPGTQQRAVIGVGGQNASQEDSLAVAGKWADAAKSVEDLKKLLPPNLTSSGPSMDQYNRQLSLCCQLRNEAMALAQRTRITGTTEFKVTEACKDNHRRAFDEFGRPFLSLAEDTYRSLIRVTQMANSYIQAEQDAESVADEDVREEHHLMNPDIDRSTELQLEKHLDSLYSQNLLSRPSNVTEHPGSKAFFEAYVGSLLDAQSVYDSFEDKRALLEPGATVLESTSPAGQLKTAWSLMETDYQVVKSYIRKEVPSTRPALIMSTGDSET
ncbi:hypothetical protein IAT40_006515 [Kwoniella sp. CBS 6097]